MKPGEKLTMTREFVVLTSCRMSSWTLRGWGHSAKAEEWEKMTGAREVVFDRTDFCVQ